MDKESSFLDEPTVGRRLRFSVGEETNSEHGGLRCQGIFKDSTLELPLVTIITVVYNNCDTLEKCIQSVLNQKYNNIEYIVIDGGSDDGTLDIIRKYQSDIDYYISEEDDGLYHAMNKGLSLALGEYIAFVNSDDYYFTDAVSSSIEHIIRNKLDISFAGFQYANKDGHAIIVDEGRGWDDSMLIQGIPGGHETVFAHKKCYNRIGGYDLSYKLAADYHWLMRAYKADFKAQVLKKTILVMAMGGTSFNESIEKEENYRLLKDNFGNLPEQTLKQLYQLKFYNNWHGCTVSDPKMLELLAEANHISKEYHRALFLTIENRKREMKGVIVPAMNELSDKLSIAIVLTHLTGVSGGAERIAIETANELDNRGHAVTVISCHGVAGEPYYPLNSNIPYIDLSIDPYKHYYESRGKNLRLNFEDLAGKSFEELGYSPTEEDFAQWCRTGHLWRSRIYNGFLSEHSFDLVISHMPSTFPYVLLGRPENDKTVHIASLHNAPLYKFYSDLYPADGPMDRYMRLYSLEKADKISILFDAFREQMPKKFREKCFTLPNFTRIKNMGTHRREKEKKIILSVGRLVPQKGHSELLKSYVKVQEVYPEWNLHIYGEGPKKEELVALCDELGLLPDEIFQGTRRDIETAYYDADIFVFPSLFEGFGLTLVEAMAFGLPVVGFDDCEGVKYLIEDQLNGFLVSRKHGSTSMTSAIVKLIESSTLRAALGERGIETAALYTVEASVDKLEKAITTCIDNKKISTRKSTDTPSGTKVALFTTYVEGGAGIAAERLCKGLSQIGQENRVFSFSSSQDERHYQTQLNQPMQALFGSLQPFMAEDNTKDGSTMVSPSYPGLVADQLSFLDYFDIINIHWIQRILSNETIAFLSNIGKPLVWTMHDMNPFTGGCHYTAGCEKYQINCSDCPQLNDTFDDFTEKVLQVKKRYWSKNVVLVSPSRWLAECARKSAVFKENRIEVIPNGLDTEVFKPTSREDARYRLKLPQNSKILLFTCHSHTERRKGFQELIKTVNLLKTHSQPYHLVTFGEESKELSELGIPYTALGYIQEEKVLALGYSAADVTVLPTLEDNLPNIILESVACGTPVVAFDSGGVSDAVVNGVNGYLVQQGDCEALANSIKVIVNDDFRDSCRSYALQEFTLEKQARRYKELFDELIENPPLINSVNTPEMFQETAPVLAKALAVKLAETQQERSRQASQIKKFQKQIQRLQDFKHRLTREKQKLKKRNLRLQKIVTSHSWQITKPLRGMKLFITDNRKARRLIRKKLLGK